MIEERAESASTFEFIHRCVQRARVKSTLRVLLIYKINEIPFTGSLERKGLSVTSTSALGERNGKKAKEKE